jgi:hypothetical protein
MSNGRDDSSIDILEFINSDDDSLFKPKVTKKKPKKINMKPSSNDKKAPKRKRKPKPADMPRRPLSAYNIFFKAQRALIIGATNPPNLDHQQKSTNSTIGPPSNFERKKRAHRKTHGKISFSNLAKEIGKNWNALPEEGRTTYVAGAAKEKLRYQEELRIYKLKKGEVKVAKKKSAHMKSASSVQENTLYRDRYGVNQVERPRYMKSPDQATACLHDEHTYPIKESPYGLEVEFAPRPTLKQEDGYVEFLDDFNPLPITYDPRCHPAAHINNNDMVKLVAPLLNRKKRDISRRRLPTNLNYTYSSDNNAYPDVQDEIRETPSFSYREEMKGNDQGQDNFLNMFLPSTEEKKYDQGNDFSSDFRGNLFSL